MASSRTPGRPSRGRAPARSQSTGRGHARGQTGGRTGGHTGSHTGGRAAQGPGRRGPERRGAATAPVAKPRFTNRMAVLVLVAAVLVVSYASSMRAYLQQRGHIADLRAQIAESERDISALEREKRRWSDDAYVETQARERLGWVMPGETSYRVIDRDGKPLDGEDGLSDPDSGPRSLPDPWWSKVYGTLETADHPERVPVPATKIVPEKK